MLEDIPIAQQTMTEHSSCSKSKLSISKIHKKLTENWLWYWWLPLTQHIHAWRLETRPELAWPIVTAALYNSSQTLFRKAKAARKVFQFNNLVITFQHCSPSPRWKFKCLARILRSSHLLQRSACKPYYLNSWLSSHTIMWFLLWWTIT